MARVVFAWELGGAYGHLARQLPVALALRARGHEPVFAVRDLMAAQALLAPHGLRVFQAPLWLGRVDNLPPPIQYAEMLMRFGYLHPAALAGICRAWRELLHLLQPALVVMDHAPTAMLATRGLPHARLNLGDGFCIPPPSVPLPPFVWWQPGDPARVHDSEAQVVAGANGVLHTLGAPLLRSLADLAQCDAQRLCTFAELDHYPGRTGAPFVGPLFALGRGADMAWPGGEGARVFAYLNPAYPALEAVLAALHGTPARVLAHVPGASAHTLARFASERLRFCTEPLDIGTMRAQCDLAVGHGGAGTVAAMLLAGKPQLLLPMHMEQAMAVRRVVDLQAAIAAPPQEAAQLPHRLAQALSSSVLARGAAAFAARHHGYDQAATVRAIADDCEALMARPPSR